MSPILERLRSLLREDDGQALVLAALLLLVIALAVLGTGQLGRSLHDRIRLQNAADAAAYSLATQEAQAFNFYAFSNRAQISHYVTILQLLSFDAMLLGILSSLGTLAALMKTAGSICGDPVKAIACNMVPVVGQVLTTISAAAYVVEGVARTASRLFLLFDTFVGTVAVPLLVAANLGLFAQQAAFFLGVASRLGGDEALRIARRSAPKAEAWGSFASQASNVARFAGAHMKEAATLLGHRDRTSEGVADGAAGKRNYARRAMSELIHATRHGDWVYDRKLPGDLGALLGDISGVKALGELFDLLPVQLRGHTRLLSGDDLRPTTRATEHTYQKMEHPGHGSARYPTGDAIGANFYLDIGGVASRLGLGLDSKHLGSVTSTRSPDKGWVCTWDLSYRKFFAVVLTIYTPRTSCTINRGKHSWWGITPYMVFDATPEDCDSAKNDFCQPDVWVALQQDNPSLFSFLEKQSTPTPDGEAPVGTLGTSGAGKLVAVSRALTYYHRPGTWREPPNFFNPYWRAKLAPVEQGLSRLGSDLLPDAVGGLLPSESEQRLWTH